MKNLCASFGKHKCVGPKLLARSNTGTGEEMADPFKLNNEQPFRESPYCVIIVYFSLQMYLNYNMSVIS